MERLRYYSLTWSNNLWINKKDDRECITKAEIKSKVHVSKKGLT